MLGFAEQQFGDLGLELNESKTRFWYLAGQPTHVPESTHPYFVDALPCLGTTCCFVRQHHLAEGEWREVAVGIHDISSPHDAVGRFVAYADRLKMLAMNGLEIQHVLTLLRTYVNGCVTYLQRALT